MEIDDLVNLVISDLDDRPPEWKRANGIPILRPVIRETRKTSRGQRFLPAEHDFLVENLQILGVEECARKIGRTAESIKVYSTRKGLIFPRHAEGYLTGNQVGKVLGVDSHKPTCWFDLGMMPAERMPYDDNAQWKRRVKILDFKKWVIRPESWVYFKAENVTDPHIRRLVELAQERWGDEWLDTVQVAKMWGTDPKGVTHMLAIGRISGVHARGLGRERNGHWAYWYIRRSDAEAFVYPKKGERSALRDFWTPAAEAFIVKAHEEWGKSYKDIRRMMKAPVTDGGIYTRYQMLKKANKKLLQNAVENGNVVDQVIMLKKKFTTTWRDQPEGYWYQRLGG